MKHQKGMKKGFSLAMSEVDHKATLWVRPIASDHQSIVKVVPGIRIISPSLPATGTILNSGT
jgi:hypothetical protein